MAFDASNSDQLAETSEDQHIHAYAYSSQPRLHQPGP